MSGLPFVKRVAKRLVPYRIRLWWAFRDAPTCNCPNPGVRPSLHNNDCPVFEEYLRWG